LQEIVVEGVPIEQTTLPILPSSSLFGFDTTVQDTPRVISQITPQQLQNTTLNTYDDFAQFAPGVTQTGSRDTPAAPTIRGGLAEIYENGISRFNPSIGFPLDLNQYESADIVSGPASVIYGPTQNSAGYVDYTTKQPFFDKQHTTVNTTLGTWDSGGQGGHDNFSIQVDNGGPIIKDELAYRVSYQGQDASSYYEGVKNSFQDIYGALSYTPKWNKDITVDWNADFVNYDYSQWNGASRVNQDLIDNNEYIGGTATPIIKSGANYYSFDDGVWDQRNRPVNGVSTIKTTGVAAPATGTPASLIGWVINPADATAQKLYGYQGTIDANDHAVAQDFNTELREKFNVDDDFTIENNSYYEYQWNNVESRGSNYYYYTANEFENRTEVIQKNDFDILGVHIEDQSNSGLDLRFISLDYEQLQEVYMSPYNLLLGDGSQTLSQLFGGGTPIPSIGGSKSGTIVINGKTYTLTNLLASVATPGAAGNFTAPGGPGSNTVDDVSALYGIFTQHNFKFDDQWGFNIGGRLTVLSADYTNPLPDPAAGSYPGGDHTVQLEPSVSASLTYKPVDWTTLYLSYDYLQALNGGTTGLFTSSTAANGNQLGDAQFHSGSYLYEAGAKFTLIPNKLYSTIAGYYQARNQAPNAALGVTAAQLDVSGVDFSVNYQPDKHWSVGANYSFVQAQYIGYAPANSGDEYGVTADGQTLFAIPTNGAAGQQLPRGSYDATGIPHNNFNAFASYQFDNGLGFKANLWAEDQQTISYYTNYKIPSQYEVDLSAFYAQPRYRGEIDFLNVTDQRNWETDINYAGSFLIEKPPFAIQGKFSLYF